MIKLHKAYFFRALEENPEDPFQHFATVSVTAMSVSSYIFGIPTDNDV
jgi:hypothetical protein